MQFKNKSCFMLVPLILVVVALSVAWAGNGRRRQIVKHYYESLYEQVFDEGFSITEKGCSDAYDVRWSKGELHTELIDEDYIDSESALAVRNESGENQQLVISFDDFLRDEKLSGQGMRFGFYARKVSGESFLDIEVQVGSTVKEYNENLENKWSCYNDILVDIAEGEKKMKMIIDVKPGQQFKLDELVLVRK